MTITSHVLGHVIRFVDTPGDKHWVWSDSGERVTEKTRAARRCLKCGLGSTPEGHDPCIANLPGVRNACCGHGVHKGYVQFDNDERTVIRGDFE